MRVSATGMLVAEGGGAGGPVEREQSGHLSRGLGGPLPHDHATADPQELRVVQEAAVDTALLPRGQGNLGGTEAINRIVGVIIHALLETEFNIHVLQEAAIHVLQEAKCQCWTQGLTLCKASALYTAELYTSPVHSRTT